ncbi:DUF7666 domain-containing protein [Leifsonia poae]|uniref:DUF7666 domain-containing protein n=1 Tax=Leifsonia poae TaxID=110933 RepID=UPI001CBE05E4|nr:hypothetical protein [Leifsonia poae]
MSELHAFKGFNEDLTCRGFQYVEGETYEQDAPARLCSTGFHAVTSPLDVFSYYPPAGSVYHAVTLDDVDGKREDDSKVAGRRIKVGARLSIPALVKAHIDFVWENVKKDDVPAASNTGYRSAASNTGDYSAASNTGYRSAASNTGNYSAASNTGNYSAASNTGDRSAASNTGDRSAASNTGDYSAASNTGYRSAASNTGDRSAASNTGDYSAASNTGYRSAASNTGNYSAASNTGNYSAASNTGYQSAASNTGYQSAASVEGAESVAIVTGKDSKASGALGCWLVLTERDDDYRIVSVQSVKVDGKKVKAGVFYTLRDGKVVTA